MMPYPSMLSIWPLVSYRYLFLEIKLKVTHTGVSLQDMTGGGCWSVRKCCIWRKYGNIRGRGKMNFFSETSESMFFWCILVSFNMIWRNSLIFSIFDDQPLQKLLIQQFGLNIRQKLLNQQFLVWLIVKNWKNQRISSNYVKTN